MAKSNLKIINLNHITQNSLNQINTNESALYYSHFYLFFNSMLRYTINSYLFFFNIKKGIINKNEFKNTVMLAVDVNTCKLFLSCYESDMVCVFNNNVIVVSSFVRFLQPNNNTSTGLNAGNQNVFNFIKHLNNPIQLNPVSFYKFFC